MAGNREELTKELQGLIRGMDIPMRRKQIAQKEDLRWLNRNMGIRNSAHANFPKVIEILKQLI